MAPSTHRHNHLTVAGILSAIVLVILKLAVGVSSRSIAVVSDGINSLFDVFTYTVMHISVGIQNRQPDDNHPFGHRRAEPLAGLLIAIFAAILGTTLVKDAVLSLFLPARVTRFSLLPVIVLFISIVTKGVLAFLYRQASRSTNSIALKAGFIDSRNDVVASSIALLGFWLGGLLDQVAGAAIGGWIVYSGVRIGLESIGYLMGVAPDAQVLDILRTEARGVRGVVGLNDLRAHYVGDLVHVEIHVEVDEALSVGEAHDIGTQVRERIEQITCVQTAFVHIDPVSLESPS